MKEEKGWSCEVNSDGSRTCKRVVRNKNGEIFETGEVITLSIDPETCERRIEGDTIIMDGEWRKLDELAKRMSGSCQRNKIKRGYS